MDPRAAQLAFEQMRKMSPEQIQQMQRQMGSMSPEMMRQAMEQMKNMGADDWDRAKQQMASMSAEDMAKAATQASAQFTAQQQYVYNGSLRLKEEGNKLHSAGQYMEAAEKYERAKQNMEGTTQPQARELYRACVLNLSSCYLNSQKYEDCITHCNLVLKDDAANLKAIYRRGQALFGKGQHHDAVRDLQRAVELAAGDAKQLPLIQEKLAAAKQKLLQQGGDVDAAVREAAATAAAPAASASTSRATGSSADVPSVSGTDPAMLQQAAEMLRSNPDMVRQAQQMMASMPEDQLAALSRQSGMNMTPDMVRAAKQNLQHMDPATLKTMAKLQSSMPEDVRRKLAGSAAGSSGQDVDALLNNPASISQAAEMMRENPEMMKMAAEMMSSMPPDELQRIAAQTGAPAGMLTPEMAKMAAESLKNMSPEDIQKMASMAAAQRGNQPMAAASASTSAPSASGGMSAPAAAAALGSMPPEALQAMGAASGMGITPDMAKMAADMMSSMSPDDIANMMKMASSMGMGPGGGGLPDPSKLGDPSAMAAMAAKMDPAMMESMMSSMRKMDKGSLAKMMMQSGMVKNQQQAEVMAAQMQNMSDEQMKWMVKAAGFMGSAGQWIKQHRLMLIGLAVLLLALLLRWLGFM